MLGENLDTTSDPQPPDSGEGRQAGRRRFVEIQFSCCTVYARGYVNRTGMAYSGNCPKCGRRVDLKIGPAGTDARFFTAY
jgi:hypothetical protein